MKTNLTSRLNYPALMLFIILALASCGQPTATPPTEPGATVKCLIQQVYSGMSAPLDSMALNESKDLEDNGKVNTDDDGEAQIEIAGCGFIYVFRDTQLEKATCRKSDYEKTHAAYCLTGGTAGVQHDCLLLVTVQTANVVVETGGTAFTVTYLPEQQVSIVIALDGVVRVQSFANRDAGIDFVELEQEVWFDDPQGIYPALQPWNNQPIPYQTWRDAPEFDVLKTAQLQDWLSRTQFRFNEADFPFPPEVLEGWSAPEGELLPGFQFSGELFNDPAVWEAVQVGVPWEEIWSSIQPDPAVRPQLTASGWEPVDPANLPYNIDQARSLLEEAAPDEGMRTMVILIPAGDPRLQEYAKVLHEHLASIGFLPEILEIEPATLREVIQTQTAAGNSTIWIQP